MRTTSPRQAVQLIPNKSATIRQSATSLWQVYHYTVQQVERLESQHNRNSAPSGENVRIWQKLFQRQRPLRDGNPVSPVGLAAGDKKTAKIGRVLVGQIRPEGVVQSGSSFCNQGHQRSITDCYSPEDKISYIFFSRDRVPILRRFGVTV